MFGALIPKDDLSREVDDQYCFADKIDKFKIGKLSCQLRSVRAVAGSCGLAVRGHRIRGLPCCAMARNSVARLSRADYRVGISRVTEYGSPKKSPSSSPHEVTIQ